MPIACKDVSHWCLGKFVWQVLGFGLERLSDVRRWPHALYMKVKSRCLTSIPP